MAEEPTTIDLRRIRVEPVEDPFEVSHLSSYMCRHHELGDKKLIGQRIVYDITFEGYILGVLYFDKAVDRNKHREAKIGWTTRQRTDRICHVANNSRFLILPEVRGVPNLASRALSLVAKRISDDWVKKYNTPILALETYVDTANEGTCYTAAGWENLGFTTGFQKKGSEERTHSKRYFLTPLHKDSYTALSADIPHALITGVKPVTGESNNNYVLDAGAIDLKALQKHLSTIPDHRSRHGCVYEFTPLLTLCMVAVFSGYTQYRQIADWIAKLPINFRREVSLTRRNRGDRTPSESLIGEFLAAINSALLEKALNTWLKDSYYPNKNPAHISIVRKYREFFPRTPFHILNRDRESSRSYRKTEYLATPNKKRCGLQPA